MTDVKVEQCDRDAAANLFCDWCHVVPHASIPTNMRCGNMDEHQFVYAFARHRQAAEKATRERDAAYIEGKGGVIPGATVFVSLITGENMPCMSGDARDKLNPHKRRQFDDATRDLATAIRSQGHE
ncbi:hypothetical protein [Sphingomonas sp. LK11]|uniref:hypothetical protein n=1 Tax=Sphingomonas sp. LK11 TaxID=1390395 RepID=UPI001560FD2B|nr:hypothetical protein [Sphingomonas sp. LK11]